MVTQQLIFGLRNHHHQSQVLSEAAVLTTLKAKIEKLQCLEATVASTDQMRVLPAPTWNGNTSAAFTRSSYKREKGGSHPPPQKTTTPAIGVKGVDEHRTKGKHSQEKTAPHSTKCARTVVSKAIFVQFVKSNLPHNHHDPTLLMIHKTRSNKTTPPTLKTHHSPSPPRIFVSPQPTTTGRNPL